MGIMEWLLSSVIYQNQTIDGKVTRIMAQIDLLNQKIQELNIAISEEHIQVANAISVLDQKIAELQALATPDLQPAIDGVTEAINTVKAIYEP